MIKKKAIICDIDQTLLDNLIPIQLKDKALSMGITEDGAWDVFYENLDLCKRNEWCFTLLEQMTINTNIEVIFITAREERARRDTEAYFKFKVPVKYKLFMRPNGCTKLDAEVKAEIIAPLLEQYDFLFALDDRIENCEVFRLFGITTLQVTSLEL